jgi:predicted DCC family thiol-disulfide oxidoreductase YuxK
MAVAVLIFDGYCNLCSGWVRFLMRIDKKKSLRFVAGQSSEGVELLSTFTTANSESVVLIREDKMFIESDAVIQVLSLLSPPYSWLTFFRFFPPAFRKWMYRLVARNRYKIFGRSKTCYIP